MVVKAQGTNQTLEGTLDESPWHFQTETGMSKQSNFLSLSRLDLEENRLWLGNDVQEPTARFADLLRVLLLLLF